MLSDTWIGDLPRLSYHLHQGYGSLSPREYALTLRRFLRLLLKHPEGSVSPVLGVRIPLDASRANDMSVRELLAMPRDKLFKALDMIVKYDGDIDAALANEPDM